MERVGGDERRPGPGTGTFDCGGGGQVLGDGSSGFRGSGGVVEPAALVRTDSTAGLDAARVSAEGESGGAGPSESQIEVSAMAAPVSTEVDREEVAGVSNMEIDLVASSEGVKPSGMETSSSLQDEEVVGEVRGRWNQGLEVGDMVWGKVKSHPWWPGFIYNETFATGSVRRSRREGYILVAFFGDSSYGWFDPAELVPFEPHFAEKSCQTTQKNFVKAVDEAVDEASRRQTLGLVCNCYNRVRFKPTTEDGYFAVDADSYEAGAIYSERQIMQARAQFDPREAVSFVQDMALNPQKYDRGSLDWVINMSTMLAYRKAVFEEFDETYAEAFGIEPVHRSADSMGKIKPPEKVPFRAPLSGPLVIAEALGEKKSSVKPRKVKDSLKKDKYLFKRRDEPNTKGLVESNNSVGDYVLQKRDPAIINNTEASNPGEVAGDGTMVFKFEVTDSINNTDTYSVVGASEQKYQHLSYVPPQIDSRDEKLISEMSDIQMEVPRKNESEDKVFDVFGFTDVQPRNEGDGYVPMKPVLSRSNMIVKAIEPITPSVEGLNGEIPFTLLEKKKKKKKKKKELGFEFDTERTFKHPKIADEEQWKAGRKSTGISSTRRIPAQSDSKREDGSSTSSFSTLAPLLPTPDLSSIQLPVLIEDVQALASDPFNGLDYRNIAVLQQVLLRFRSLVFQKSLVLQQSSEMEPGESPPKSTQDFIEVKPGMDVRDFKPSKHISRPGDPTKAARKRAPSDRQEEKTAKRIKKVNELKAITGDKKAAVPKEMEVQKVEKKEASSGATPVKPLTKSADKQPKSADSNKKFQARTAEPTSLVLKFPQGATLPSVPQLKARFGRFGPLDLSGMRLYWKSYTCRVVYKHKGDAHAAYNYALRNNNLFGSVRVAYQLKEYEAPGRSDTADGKRRPNEGADETVASFKSSGVDTSIEPRPPLQQSRVPVRLKSCLKKPTSEDGGAPFTKESPRVKFLLGDEEDNSGRLEQTVMTGNNSSGIVVNELGAPASNNGSSLGYSITSTSKNMNFSSSSMISTTPPPLIPLAPPLRVRPEHTSLPSTSSAGGMDGAGFDQSRTRCQTRLYEMEERWEGVDISQQMLSLMLRCSDIVSNVKCSLGYVPYHPL